MLLLRKLVTNWRHSLPPVTAALKLAVYFDPNPETLNLPLPQPDKNAQCCISISRKIYQISIIPGSEKLLFPFQESFEDRGKVLGCANQFFAFLIPSNGDTFLYFPNDSPFIY